MLRPMFGGPLQPPTGCWPKPNASWSLGCAGLTRIIRILPLSRSHVKTTAKKFVEFEMNGANADNVSLETMLQAARTVDAHSPAQILFTSGTTGMPKPVVLSHRNLVSNALAKLDAAPQSSLDLRLNVLPFCHAYARTCELSTWILTAANSALQTAGTIFWNLHLRSNQHWSTLCPTW